MQYSRAQRQRSPPLCLSDAGAPMRVPTSTAHREEEKKKVGATMHGVFNTASAIDPPHKRCWVKFESLRKIIHPLALVLSCRPRWSGPASLCDNPA